MKTLAIETSCDDTSIAIVVYDNGHFFVEHMRTIGQTGLHNQYGGVVPELAYRAHADNIVTLIAEHIQEHADIDFITVTARPGLPGALAVGIAAAHTLTAVRDIPVYEVNHIMGHVFSHVLEKHIDIVALPYVCLTVSGGHSDIYLVTGVETDIDKENITNDHERNKRQHLGIGDDEIVGPYRVKKLGQTRDDAAGEAFDKVARLLGGPYPGGARLSKLAAQGGHHEEINLRVTQLSKESYEMSFSGLKSQVHNLLRKLVGEHTPEHIPDAIKANIAWAFQEQITGLLAKKLGQAVEEFDAKSIGVVGGVSANTRLREQVETVLKAHDKNIPMYTPVAIQYCTDNAAMIGVVGILQQL